MPNAFHVIYPVSTFDIFHQNRSGILSLKSNRNRVIKKKYSLVTFQDFYTQYIELKEWFTCKTSSFNGLCVQLTNKTMSLTNVQLFLEQVWIPYSCIISKLGSHGTKKAQRSITKIPSLSFQGIDYCSWTLNKDGCLWNFSYVLCIACSCLSVNPCINHCALQEVYDEISW